MRSAFPNELLWEKIPKQTQSPDIVNHHFYYSTTKTQSTWPTQTHLNHHKSSFPSSSQHATNLGSFSINTQVRPTNIKSSQT